MITTENAGRYLWKTMRKEKSKKERKRGSMLGLCHVSLAKLELLGCFLNPLPCLVLG